MLHLSFASTTICPDITGERAWWRKRARCKNCRGWDLLPGQGRDLHAKYAARMFQLSIHSFQHQETEL